MLEAGRRMAARGTPEQRAEGYTSMGRALINLEGDAAAAAAYRRAIQLGGGDGSAAENLADIEYGWGRDERVSQLRRLGAEQFQTKLRDRKYAASLTPEGRRASEAYFRANLLSIGGDFAGALAADLVIRDTGNVGGFGSVGRGIERVANSRARLHDIYGALDDVNDSDPTPLNRAQSTFAISNRAGDWPAALAAPEVISARLAERADKGAMRMRWRADRARALVGLGRLDEAEALLATTPLDCSYCIMVRALAAEGRGDRRTADHWFAEAARMTPSLPFVANEWGRAMLARGEPGQALAKFEAGRALSPRYPDAIEGRGEALLAAGDAAGAATAFAQAATLAPKWGRLHLMWGRALARLGKPAEAQAQYRQAAALYLTAAERTELTRHGR
jgi:Flp pilus assembly protein TadD